MQSLYREPETGRFIVDWDMAVSTEAELRPYYERLYNGAELTVNQINGIDDVYDETSKHELTYCVSDSFGANKQRAVDAMAESTEAWMASADVTFTYVPAEDANCTASNNNVFYDVNPTTGGQFIARAFFPSSPRDQRNILIDDTAFDIGDDDPFNLANVLAHENGHVLGFRHEHVRANIFDIPFDQWLSCVLEGLIDQNYRPVTDYDSASVMHYPQCGGTGALQITELDVQGVQDIYGPPQG
ncbi:MAG TPA: matrixin family metalloprotease [Kofleriaceae bacterium]|nr:matrixin family metalloprotease [Kofleriaceae bacterium]